MDIGGSSINIRLRGVLLQVGTSQLILFAFLLSARGKKLLWLKKQE